MTWNDNKGEPEDRSARGDIMQGADLNAPRPPLRPFPFGMAIGALAEIAVKLVISGYILAVVVYVNATGNWDKDDDLGTCFCLLQFWRSFLCGEFRARACTEPRARPLCFLVNESYGTGGYSAQYLK